MEALHPKVAQVQSALHEAGVDITVRQIEESTPTAAAAAEYLGRVSYIRSQTRIAANTTPARYVTASLS